MRPTKTCSGSQAILRGVGPQRLKSTSARYNLDDQFSHFLCKSMRRNRDQWEARRRGRFRAVREPGRRRKGRVRNLSDGSAVVVLAKVDIAVIFDEERFGERDRRRASGHSAPRRRRRGGYRGAVHHRQLSKLGERRGIRGRDGHARVVADTTAGQAHVPAPGDSRRSPQMWHSICESGMNGKPAWSPVPEFAPRDLGSAATL